MIKIIPPVCSVITTFYISSMPLYIRNTFLYIYEVRILSSYTTYLCIFVFRCSLFSLPGLLACGCCPCRMHLSVFTNAQGHPLGGITDEKSTGFPRTANGEPMACPWTARGQLVDIYIYIYIYIYFLLYSGGLVKIKLKLTTLSRSRVVCHFNL